MGASVGAGELLIDPHVHSAGSYDGSEPVRDILKRAQALGLDGVVVTDHNRLFESLIAADLAPEYGLLGLPGVEVSTADGHLLAVGVRDRPPAGEPLVRTVESVRDLGGAAIVPHPFRRSRHGARRGAIVDCDGIETLNACSVSDYRNRQATRFAATEGYPAIGGSDAHTVRTIGRAYTRIDLRTPIEDPTTLDTEAVVEAIRAGRTAADGRRASRRVAVRKYARNARLKTASLL